MVGVLVSRFLRGIGPMPAKNSTYFRHLKHCCRFLGVARTIGIEEDTDRLGRELPRGKLLSTLSSPAILFANHTAPCRQALGRMLLHPLGELGRAHQAGLHRD